MPATPTKGSIEIVTNPQDPPNAISDGMTVEAVTVGLVPTLVAAVYGITDLQGAEPENTQIAAWTGTNGRFQPVRVNLWPEVQPQAYEGEVEA